MARYALENEKIRIEVDPHGAELKSLFRKDTGKEYMWCGDAKYWGRTSPVLFPFVGMPADGIFRAKGKEWSMGQHGFARDMNFVLEKETEDALWFLLESSEETLKKYPYAFLLHIGYQLEGDGVTVLWKVENPSGEDLPFSIGGHPAFNCPLEEQEKQTDYSIFFEGAKQVVSHRIENGVVVEKEDTYLLEQGYLNIQEHLFDHDALVIEKQQIRKVALCRPDRTPYLTVEMDAPLFGVWSPVGKQAPFVCIEPWYGRCDPAGFTGEVADREWSNLIAPGQCWERSYRIRV